MSPPFVRCCTTGKFLHPFLTLTSVGLMAHQYVRSLSSTNTRLSFGKTTNFLLCFSMTLLLIIVLLSISAQSLKLRECSCQPINPAYLALFPVPLSSLSLLDLVDLFLPCSPPHLPFLMKTAEGNSKQQLDRSSSCPLVPLRRSSLVMRE